MANQDETLSTAESMKMILDKDKIITELLHDREGARDAIPTFQIMPDLSKGIKDFRGDGNSATARDWLENLKSTATLHKWPH